MDTIRFIDLFCGIGGFRIAAEAECQARGVQPVCVFSSDIDPDARLAYAANFGEKPAGDIKGIDAASIPDHDILLAGFPCQPFSIIGDKKGFEDTRGTLFFDVARILMAKRPRAFVLENVKMLAGHDGGRTLSRIMETLQEIGYYAQYRVLNALDFGLPQKRERVFIVGTLEPIRYEWTRGGVPMRPLADLLEREIPEFYYASEHIKGNRRAKHGQQHEHPTIWHENKAGHISAYPYSCALRAGASYNYLLVNGERRLTEREMLRLQGFPDSFKIVCGYSATRKQVGNAVAIPCVRAVLGKLLDALNSSVIAEDRAIHGVQANFLSSLLPLETDLGSTQNHPSWR